MPQFIALVRKEAPASYVVEFPDFPACVTRADSADEGRLIAAEALALHVAGLVDDGARIPPPASLDDIIAARPGFNDIVLSVWIPSPSAKKERICCFLAHDLLSEIDRAAQRRGISRSVFLARGAEKELRSDAA